MGAAIIKTLRVAAAIIKDIFQNSGENILKILVGVVTVIMLLLLFFIIPIVIHERVPIAKHEQALWYYEAAKKVSESTVSPCDDGVYVDWQDVIAIDAYRLKQNFKKSSPEAALELAEKFIEPAGTCTYCTGEGEEETCTTYTTYRLRSITEVMADLGLTEEEQEIVISKYRAIDFNFLIGFSPKSEIGDYDALYSGDLIWPVPGYHYVSSPFGMRIHPTLGTKRMHYGIDIPSPAYTKVVAAANGKVISVAKTDAVGWIIVIDHGQDDNGRRITTRYLHVMNSNVRPGQKVEAGQVICEIADHQNMGYLSTGPHLHFEIMVDGINQDPAKYFRTS